MIDTIRKPFLIKSENLEKMRPAFIEASKIIRQAVDEKRLIVIKHHDDVDGYTCGVALEKAISPLINDQRKHYYFVRQASRAPYFEYIDALRELNNSMYGHDNRPPLIILADLGSNSQSIDSINRLTMYGFDFIILDHHKFDPENKKISKVFLNPHAFGIGSDINAGALAVELALFINPLLTNLDHLPGLSAVADKSSGPEIDAYLGLSGMQKEELERWAIVIDHELFYLRFPPNIAFLEELFFMIKKKKPIVDMLYSNISKDFSRLKESLRRYIKIKEYPSFKLFRIDRQDVGDWDYASSKMARLATELHEGPRVVFIDAPDSITYRADKIEFRGVELIGLLKEKFPHAMVSGGGHDAAGSIRFNAASRKEISSFIDGYLDKL